MPPSLTIRPPRGAGSLSGLLLVVGLVAVGVAVGLWWGELTRAAVRPQEPRAVTARGELAADERATIELFERVAPSVVYITSITRRRDWFTLNVQEIPSGTGSGFVWDERGHIVTNFHVIQRASRARVTLADRSTWEAEVIGAAPEKDLAVLRVDAPDEVLPPIAIGSSMDLRVGQKTFAIGNPFGLDQSLTTGVVSALGREIESVARIPIRDVVQTDAAINPGNSGGPLLDSAGRLIGVNTAIFSPSGASAGIGFAIPVDTVNWVVPDIIAFGRLRRPTLGIETLPTRMIRGLDVEGALVMRLAPGGGAERAGLRATRRDGRGRVELGDIIVAVGKVPIRSDNDLVLALERYEEGDRVRVEVLREGTSVTVEVELGPPSG